MKHYFFLSLFFCYAFSLSAAYLGNPALPDLIEEGFFFSKENNLSVKIGYIRDYLFDRSMKLPAQGSRTLDQFSSLSDQGVGILTILNRMEIYAQGGAIGFCTKQQIAAGIQNEYQSYHQFLWGVGARALLAKWNHCFLGMAIQYQRAQPRIKWITQNGVPITPFSSSRLSFSEWQIGLGLGYEITIFYPYIAVKYSHAKARFTNLPLSVLLDTPHFRAENRRKFGLVIGTSLTSNCLFSLNIESRFIDEQAITLTAEIKL